MAWNQPGNNGQDRDPGSSNNQGGNSGEMATKVVAIRGPPDLDDIFPQAKQKLGGVWWRKRGLSSGGNSTRARARKWVVASWHSGRCRGHHLAASGFYTIKASRRGVVCVL